jgi:hypothetical protein
MDIFDKSSINHNNLGLLFVKSLLTTSRSEGHLVGYYFQNLCCTELCPCQGNDLCLNIITSQQNPDDDDEEAAPDD